MEIEEKVTRRRNLTSHDPDLGAELFQRNMAEAVQLENEIFRLIKLIKAAGQPQGEWVNKKRSELLSKFEQATREMSNIEGKRRGGSDEFRNILYVQESRVRSEMGDAKKLLGLL